MNFPLIMEGKQLESALPHGPLIQWIDRVTINRSEPNGDSEGFQYTVVGELVVPEPVPHNTFVERVKASGMVTRNDLLGLILSEHFPGQPVMRGVDLLETIGLTGTPLIRLDDGAMLQQVNLNGGTLPDNIAQYLGWFGGFNGVRFNYSAKPGMSLAIEFVVNTKDISFDPVKKIFMGTARGTIKKKATALVTVNEVQFIAVPPQ